jgi:hypothetical protein
VKSKLGEYYLFGPRALHYDLSVHSSNPRAACGFTNRLEKSDLE